MAKTKGRSKSNGKSSRKIISFTNGQIDWIVESLQNTLHEKLIALDFIVNNKNNHTDPIVRRLITAEVNELVESIKVFAPSFDLQTFKKFRMLSKADGIGMGVIR